MSELELKHLPNAFRNQSQVNDDEENHNDDSVHESDEMDNGEQESHEEAGYDDSKNENDLNAMRGRVKKLEEEKARLEAVTQNHAFLQGKLLEQQEREKIHLAEIERLKQAQQSAPAQNDSNFDISEEEKQALIDDVGERAAKLILSRAASPASAGLEMEELKKQIQRNEFAFKQRAFQEEVNKQIPDLQGLLTDQNFMQFLENKRDFLGNTAMKAMEDVGNNLDIGRIPFVKELVDEYRQKSALPKTNRKPNAVPQVASNGLASENNGKRKRTREDRMLISMYSRMPSKRKELEKLLRETED